ncbi:uncharacterized protein PV09_04604 [Verruconis gallopava]|uniref:Secreted protein n=1 Tax=Verruconis gallopava TaxID=253628 RepID=A0A0D1XP05_9PEZI|nr:uncharacterized protein PV09_04604 [Verruconis gallopava]KIW04311.1 hypothetical protein PV09_04604 [Verruconis gallopava]
MCFFFAFRTACLLLPVLDLIVTSPSLARNQDDSMHISLLAICTHVVHFHLPIYPYCFMFGHLHLHTIQPIPIRQLAFLPSFPTGPIRLTCTARKAPERARSTCSTTIFQRTFFLCAASSTVCPWIDC